MLTNTKACASTWLPVQLHVVIVHQHEHIAANGSPLLGKKCILHSIYCSPLCRCWPVSSLSFTSSFRGTIDRRMQRCIQPSLFKLFTYVCWNQEPATIGFVNFVSFTWNFSNTKWNATSLYSVYNVCYLKSQEEK